MGTWKLSTCVNLSMMKAAAEVKALPIYAACGEVCKIDAVDDNVGSINSGSLLMLDTT